MKAIFSLLLTGSLFLLPACHRTDKEIRQMRFLSPGKALFWPDYANCTIPCNIAPLNFYLLPRHEHFRLKAYGSGADTLHIKGKYRVRFPKAEWEKLLSENRNGKIRVEIELKEKETVSRTGFEWEVSDPIDPYLTCRLIEPSYQMSSHLQTVEIGLTDFGRRILFDNNLTEGSCVNCHTYAQNDPNFLVYHVRFTHTGTYILLNDEILRVDLKSDTFPQGGVYPSWHPGRKHIAFGTASAYPFVHSLDIERRTEVYDSMGDLFVYDIDKNLIFSDRRICGPEKEETFPCWSRDSRQLYFCQAGNPLRDSTEDDTEFSKKIKYDLMRIAFDTASGCFGKLDTLIDNRITGKSVSFPRISPDGRFLVFCLSDHGTFPIRHPESDLYLLDLQADPAQQDSSWKATGGPFKMKRIERINSGRTESYHTWSSNGKWLMFSSKREDGMYARPYFSHIDSSGNASKPFLLPTEDPAFYLSFLKSFNIPEFSTGQTPLTLEKADEATRLPVRKPRIVIGCGQRDASRVQ